MTILMSQAVAEERIAFGSSIALASMGQVRWRRLAALYRDSFIKYGMAIEDIVRPEIYQTEVARTVLGLAVGDWHLAVKPPHHLRPFHGIPNAFIFDGHSYDHASGPDGSLPFPDPMTVFAKADAILCTTEASLRTLTAMGLENAILLPPSLPMPPISADLCSPHVADDGVVRFGTFLDWDASLDALSEIVSGLMEASTQKAGLKLVVVVPPEFPPLNVAQWAARRFGSETARVISSISLDLERECVSDLLQNIDYAISINSEDQLSIRLAQAMCQGIPTVNCSNVATALLEAARANTPRWREASLKTRREAESKFGIDAFKTRVAALQRQLGGWSS